MTTLRTVKVHRIGTAGPDDIEGLRRAIDDGEIDPKGIVAILGKTEGNGCVNDFTRGYTSHVLKHALASWRGSAPDAIARDVAIVMSGGTEGGLSPHLLVFEVGAIGLAPSEAVSVVPSLAVGVAMTRAFAPEEIGRMPQVEATADAVRRAMQEAGIESARDVHYVQVKCPLLTKQRIADAHQRGRSVATLDTYRSMGYSRGASALGIGLALGELRADQVCDSEICSNAALYSGVASTSAGIELMENQILVVGNSPRWGGDLVIGHGVMQDAIDTDAVFDALAPLTLSEPGRLTRAERERVVAVLAKAEPSASGEIRGRRHTMLDDSDIQASRHARALVGGVLAGVFGDTQLFVSGGAEHQGPDGGGPVAVIASRAPSRLVPR
ncbi:ring-opening amidohydrolase [Pararobbsia silviterrae]|uniref:Cyanuric acid amidohydrolase n=1 Tax=Pararobbsia silviterrae TaxID=1792498 RepID=A0A494XWH9_9BURK|nr:ring-opening amidohydrolase [Pararobbsia silviterrae]RKP51953.1 ring-opening amidohydrolase [Pararobbsia silviterrae]